LNAINYAPVGFLSPGIYDKMSVAGLKNYQLWSGNLNQRQKFVRPKALKDKVSISGKSSFRPKS
jgi:hypothetical protein